MDKEPINRKEVRTIYFHVTNAMFMSAMTYNIHNVLIINSKRCLWNGNYHLSSLKLNKI